MDAGAQPLVSVIVPTRDRPRQLAEAVRSVLGQTYRNVEVIVVNDGGVDVSGELPAHDGPARLVYLAHPANRGVAAARNTAIRASHGQYIAYLDDDDRFYPDHLDTLVSFLEAGSHRVAYTDAHRAHQALRNGVYVTTHRDVPYSVDFDAIEILHGNFVPTPCVVHARSCFEAVGMFDESLKRLEDWDLWIRMSRKFPFAHLRKVTCEFSWRDDGTTMTSTPDRAFAEATKVVLKQHGLIALRRERERSERLLAVARSLKVCCRKEKTVIWGRGGEGRLVRGWLQALGVDAAAFVDGDVAAPGAEVDGLPVVGPDALASGRYPREATAVVVAAPAPAEVERRLEALGWRRDADFVVVSLPASR
jgi:hypothetical protein